MSSVNFQTTAFFAACSGDTSIQVSMIESTGGSDDPNVVPRKRKEEDLLDPTVPNDHPILKVHSYTCSDFVEKCGSARW